MSRKTKKKNSLLQPLVCGLKNTAFVSRLRLWVDGLLRFWSLRVIPFADRLVLPGSAGVSLLQIVRHFSNRELWISAKSLSYSFLMALPPLLIFFFSLIPYFPIEGIQNELLFQLGTILPAGLFDRVSVTITDVMSHKHSSLLSIGFITSVILAANGLHGLLQSFNSVSHSIEWRSFVRRYALCLLLVLLLFVLVVVILSLLIGYKFLIQYLLSRNIMSQSALSLFAFNLGRWCILVILTLFTLSLLYYLAPVKKQRIGFFSIGSLVSTLLIFGLSWAFQVYLNNFNSYNLLYGSIGTLLVLMLWIYANCIVILSGYAVNIAVVESCNAGDLMQLQRRRRSHRVHSVRTHFALLTDNPMGRQPAGSHLYHSPSGISKFVAAKGCANVDNKQNRQL